MKIPGRKKLRRCKSCTRDGQPYLVADSDGEPYFFLSCDACQDDTVFFRSESEAMAAYLEKYARDGKE